jgi:hypothetical protein
VIQRLWRRKKTTQNLKQMNKTKVIVIEKEDLKQTNIVEEIIGIEQKEEMKEIEEEITPIKA